MKKTILYRNLQFLGKYFGKELRLSIWMGFVKAVFPLLTIYVSSRIIAEIISPERELGRLSMWAVYAVVAIGLQQGIVAVGNAVTDKYQRMYYKFYHVLNQKYNSLEVKLAEDTQVIDKMSQIRQTHNLSYLGLLYFLIIIPQFIEAITLILGSGGLLLSFFQKKVARAEFAVLDLGWLTGLFFVILFLCNLLAYYLEKRGNQIYQKIMENLKLGNRLAHYFLFLFPADAARWQDYRIYDQSGLLLKGLSDNPFSKGKNFDRYVSKVSAPTAAIATLLNRLQILLIYLMVGARAYAGAFSIDYFSRYIGGMMQLMIGVGLLLKIWGEYRMCKPYSEMGLDFMALENDSYKGSLTTEKRQDRKYEIEFCNVGFHYPNSEEWVLKNINLKFEIGKKMAIVGRNGSGKTTFIKLLTRFYEPQEGKILLNGIDIRKYRYDEYLRIFSVVFQDYKLFAYPVGQNIAGCINYDKERVMQVLRDVGMEEKVAGWENGADTYLFKEVEEDGILVSGGESQKIAIARALYGDAPFLILDEPTAALDAVAEAEIYEKLGEIVRDRTAIFISHRLSSCKFSDHIIVFDKGQIIEQGNHESLYRKEGEYRHLWDAQAGFYTSAGQSV